MMQHSPAKISMPENHFFLGNQVLVFYGNLSEFESVDCLHVLSENEIARAEKYLLSSDRQRFIVTKAILKHLLSRFSTTDAKEIVFDLGQHGKPFLQEHRDLQFNSSHAGDAFVIGLANGKAIGVDVEDLRRKVDISKLENHLFTSRELQQFRNLPASERQEAFLTSWTRKEAILKASGDGMSQAMNMLEITESSEVHKTDWHTETFTPMKHYCATVAIQGKVSDIQYIPVSHTDLSFHTSAE